MQDLQKDRDAWKDKYEKVMNEGTSYCYYLDHDEYNDDEYYNYNHDDSDSRLWWLVDGDSDSRWWW